MKYFQVLAVLASASLFVTPARAEPIPNIKIDADHYLLDVQSAHALRATRRVTEDAFIKMAGEKNTIVLDARSSKRFEQMHIVGAKNLPFTDFTADALKAVIPTTDTRVLIYCNNNIANSPLAFAEKAAPASLNLSTYPSLYTYGYRNVFELGPVIDPAKAKIKFQGSIVAAH